MMPLRGKSKLIIRLDSPASKIKVWEALKMFRGVTGISDKLTISDIEILADDKLFKKMKKAEKTSLLSYEEGKREIENIKKKYPKAAP